MLVDAVDDFRVDLDHQMFSMPGPYVDRYVVCAENGLGGKVLEHVLENMVYATDELGDHRVDDVFGSLDPLLRATAPGAGGVLFLPWLRGSLAPGGDANMRGGFVHMSLDTTRRDMVRAVVEGIAHNLGWLLPHVERFTGAGIDEVAFVGGAARSPAWCGILADVLARPITALHAPDRSVARARRHSWRCNVTGRSPAPTSTRFPPESGSSPLPRTASSTTSGKRNSKPRTRLCSRSARPSNE